MPRIGLLGDVMLGRGVADAIARGSPKGLWSPELQTLLRECDLVVANLECCISARGTPTDRVAGKPFFFRGPPEAVDSLRAIGVGAVGLANNHALDYEGDALLDTFDLLEEAGIAFAGAGRDETAARRGVVIDADGSRVGLIAVSDHPPEFAAAPGAPGIAYAGLRRGLPDWLAEELRRLRETCDLLIAFPHWGPNMTSEPAPWQRGTASALQDAGADLVGGHSAHVFHGVGWGARGPLLFDLGDALDDYRVDPLLRNDLGILALWTPGGAGAELELVALALDYCHTRLAEDQEAEWIAARLERACGPLGVGVERLTAQRLRVYESGANG
jgi:poly-gamma-glutamate capsule biosynthesis protein CapA/YwtB (metallophosphatase superfamily)